MRLMRIDVSIILNYYVHAIVFSQLQLDMKDQNAKQMLTNAWAIRAKIMVIVRMLLMGMSVDAKMALKLLIFIRASL